MEHFINIAIHVLTGTVGILLGLIVLVRAKGSESHKRLGCWFGYMCLVVCLSAAVGLIFFRFLPMFAILNLLVFYQLISGWRSAHTRHMGPSEIDLFFTLAASIIFFLLLPVVLKTNSGAPVILYSTISALILMLVYDVVRWFFPRRFFAVVWKYEHAYKLISCLFGMISALVGNVVRWGQPWSQIVPSVVGVVVIIYFFYRLSLELKFHKKN